MKNSYTWPKSLGTLIWLIICALCVVKITHFLKVNWHQFVAPYDHVSMSKTYSESQYVIGEKSVGGIGDDGVYSFAGATICQEGM